jgi:hypothetical protein
VTGRPDWERFGLVPADVQRRDYSDPTFVLGAVLAQVEDLTPEQQRAVLLEALASLDVEPCADCGQPVEYVDDQWRHVDPTVECFLHRARD